MYVCLRAEDASRLSGVWPPARYPSVAMRLQKPEGERERKRKRERERLNAEDASLSARPFTSFPFSLLRATLFARAGIIRPFLFDALSRELFPYFTGNIFT